MSQGNILTFTRKCPVTAVGTDQAFTIATVKAGDLVVASGLRRIVPSDASTDSTWQFGLVTGGLVLGATIDTEGAVNSLAGSTVTMFRVTADDKLNVRYVQGATDGATAPTARVLVQIIPCRGAL